MLGRALRGRLGAFGSVGGQRGLDGKVTGRMHPLAAGARGKSPGEQKAHPRKALVALSPRPTPHHTKAGRGASPVKPFPMATPPSGKRGASMSGSILGARGRARGCEGAMCGLTRPAGTGAAHCARAIWRRARPAPAAAQRRRALQLRRAASRRRRAQQGAGDAGGAGGPPAGATPPTPPRNRPPARACAPPRTLAAP